jgi:photosystem II stability/assembly factor-like uncharacterized protein
MKKLATLLICLTLCAFANAQWVTNGPFGATVLCDTRFGNDIYVGTDVGVFKSTDDGQTWSRVSTNLPRGQGVEVLFYNGTHMYGGIGTKGVYVSSDGGVTWTAANNTALGNPSYVSGIVEHNGAIVIACSEGFFSTTNQGSSWTTLDDLGVWYPGRLYSDGTNLFTHVLSGDILWKSTDNGVTWDSASHGMNAIPYVLQLFWIGGDMYALGWHVFKSTDDGDTWTIVNALGNPFFADRACVLGNTIYASRGGSLSVDVWKMAITDTAWTNITNNLVDGMTNAMFSAGTDVFIDKSGVLYKTSNGGTSWSMTGNTGMCGVDISSVFAAGQNVLAGGYETLYRSTDNGLNWSPTSLAVSSADVTAIHGMGSSLYAATNGDGLYISTDNGATWPTQKLATRELVDIADNGTHIYAGGDKHVFSSPDGQTWSNFMTGLPGSIGVSAVHATATDVYAGVTAGPPHTNAGVWKSPVAAAAWVQKSVGINPEAAVCFTQMGDVIYAGTDEGVYHSTNGGETWVLDGIDTREVRALIAVSTNLYAATDNGVYGKPSNGAWADISGDLVIRDVTSISYNNNYLYVGARDASVWQAPMTAVGVDQREDVTSRISVRPNPSDGILHIEVPSSGRLSVFSNTGSLIHEEAVAAEELTINLEDHPAGIYVIRFSGDDNRASAQKVIIR